ncbi:MAG: type II toxin-antitoxin system VapB family antitoxin [Gammaproteobacteria bacterium]|nr:type II toxin-antitoxin system VapB family antitoxin [Gammaproteobacteria bacterium]
MALNIRDRIAEKLAAATRALRDHLVKVQRRRAGRDLRAELDKIARHCASLPVVDNRAPNHILGYDDNGLPT